MPTFKGIQVDGVIYTPEGMGGNVEKEWKLINDVTLEEETNTIEITKDLENNNFEYDEVIFFLRSVGTQTNDTISNNNAVLILSNYDNGFFLISIAFKNGVTRTICVAANAKPFYYNAYIYNGGQNMGGGRAIEDPAIGFSYVDKLDSINSIKIKLQACFFGVGTRLKIYGYKR